MSLLVVCAKRENLTEGDIAKLMKFLAEEVEGAMAANNINALLVHIPRWIGPSNAITIHVFCDASVRAYDACLYARHTVDNSTE
ncbi:hypothetical protein NPIL_487821 [Nephila pilipes]|uniref:Uncharacterized protein n=1 Tax=Nephila pilipes TaxID=299642 RepID=A0A8X6NCL7_NEPPI|nr:hypothetical protein NPIL_487821 [Nephila pilipes]